MGEILYAVCWVFLKVINFIYKLVMEILSNNFQKYRKCFKTFLSMLGKLAPQGSIIEVQSWFIV